MSLRKMNLRNWAWLVFFYGLHLWYAYGVIGWQRAMKVKEICHGYWVCSRYLQRASLGHYLVDLADGQWREFRQSLFLLCVVAIGTSLLDRSLRRLVPTISLAPYRAIIGAVMVIVQHGYHSLIIFSIIFCGFHLVKYFSAVHPQSVMMKLCPYFVWLYGIGVLFFKESYRLKYMEGFHFLIPLFDKQYGGMYGWQLPANFLVLRIISFSMDNYWAIFRHSRSGNSGGQQNIVHKSDQISENDENSKNSKLQPDLRDVNHDEDSPCDLSSYNLTNCFAYCLYGPLYMAGPIISFNQFMKYDTKSQSSTNIFFYMVRLVASLFLLETMTNMFPFFAVVSSGLLPHLKVSEIAVVFYIVLKLMWLKFLVIWRFFRLWALFDGVYAPENMIRCMSNNYSLEEFWRGWHTSFNRWIIRYIYKPLGGRSHRYISVWAIFLFVALWHDLEWKLILWGLLNGGFFTAEVAIKSFWFGVPTGSRTSTNNSKHNVSQVNSDNALNQYDKNESFSVHVLYALSGSVYILVLITVNLVGYSVGSGTISLLVDKFNSWDGFWTLLTCLYFLSIGVSIMLNLRRYKICSV